MASNQYQYGTSPRKIEPNIERRKQRTNVRVVKNVPRQQIKILVAISCRNSQIDKKFNQIQNQKKELATLQKENEQLKVSIENSLNISNIEKVAKEELGMVKLTGKQTVYISLPKKDYVESASEKIIIEEEKSWFEELIDKILNI